MSKGHKRSSDGIMMEMHGDIRSLIAYQKTTQQCLATTCERLEVADKRIRATEDEIVKIKGLVSGVTAVGAFVVIVFGVITSYLGIKK